MDRLPGSAEQRPPSNGGSAYVGWSYGQIDAVEPRLMAKTVTVETDLRPVRWPEFGSLEVSCGSDGAWTFVTAGCLLGGGPGR